MNAIITNLTADQKDRARYIITCEAPADAIRDLAEPPPLGVGVQLSRATFFRLKSHLAAEDALSTRDANKVLAGGVAREESNEPFTHASLALLKERAFELSASSETSDLQAASRILLNVQKIENERNVRPQPSSLQLTEALQFEIAKIALLHFGEIGSIRGNESLAEDRKAQMVAERLFASLKKNALPQSTHQRNAA